MLIPFRRERGDYASGTGVDLILSHAQQILGTRCSDGRDNDGELEWLPEFGSLLYKLRHQNIKPVMAYQARAYVVGALARWEPRLRVSQVRVAEDGRRILIYSQVRVVDEHGRAAADGDRVLETEILKGAS